MNHQKRFCYNAIVTAIQLALVAPSITLYSDANAQSCLPTPDSQDAQEGSSTVDPQNTPETVPDDDVAPPDTSGPDAPAEDTVSAQNDASAAPGSPSGTDGNGANDGGIDYGSYGGWGSDDYGCVDTRSAMPGGLLAADVRIGSTLQLAHEKTLEPGTGVVSYSKAKPAEGFRIMTESGASLICSDTAPIPTPEGLVVAPKLHGRLVAVRRDRSNVVESQWEKVVSVTAVGRITVQHITVGDKCFWAGERADAYILHHNLKDVGGGGGWSGDGFYANADPINLALGDKSHVQIDYLSKGAAPLRVGRVYHSNANVNTARVTVPMGAGWHGYYDRSLQSISGTQIRLHRQNGRTLDFVLNGSAWSSTPAEGSLTQVSGGWQYISERNTVETYNSSGRLQSLSDGGLVTSMQYDGSNRLVGVVNPFGRSLVYAYDSGGRVATVTLPDNSSLTYGYDGNNNLTAAQFSDSSVRKYAYENTSFPHALTGVIDESGRRRLTWGYDSAGRPNSGSYGGTNAVNVTYNGNQVTSTDARGTQRIRTFSVTSGKTVLTSIRTSATVDSAASGWTFSYDSNGHPQSVTTRTGEVRQLSADLRGRVTAMTRASNTSTPLSAQTIWHPTFRKRTQLISLGTTTNYTVDGYGRTTQVARTAGNTAVTLSSRSFNSQNLMQSVTDARGAVTSFAYDNAGNVSSVTDPLGAVTTYQNYNAHGQAGMVTRSDGTVISRTFDARFRLATRTVAGAQTQYSYDAAGRLAKVTEPSGSWRNYAYDTGGFLTSATNDRSEKLTVTRDATGTATQTKTYTAAGTAAQQATRQVNAVGHTAAIVDSQNRATKLLYGSDGRLSGTLDPLGLNRSVQFDMLDRLAGTTVPNTTAMRSAGGAATVSTAHSYDSNSNRISSTDTRTVATGYAYSGFNYANGESSNDAGSVGYVRNAIGDIGLMSTARNVTISVSHDALGRVTGTAPSSNSGSANVARTYTYVAGRTDGHLSKITDESGSTTWTYDSVGRMLAQSQNFVSNTGMQRSLSIARDSLGRPTSVTYPSGMVLRFNYSADVVSSLSVNGTTVLSNVTYQPFSQTPTGWRWGNGSNYSRTFDADGHITAVTLGSKVRSYGYDAAGHVISLTDTAGSSSAITTYAYDEAGQLTMFAPPSGTGQSFTYDTNHNRQTESFNGVTNSYSYVANTNRLSSLGNIRSFSYGADGSLASGGDTGGAFNLTYDVYGRLSSASNRTNHPVRIPFVTSYLRNGLGQLVFSSAGDSSSDATVDTTFTYDEQGRLLGEYNADGGYSQETVWFNDMPVATFQGGVVYYIYPDNLTTPRSIVRASDGAELWRWDSDPFGTTAPINPNPKAGALTYNLRFPGQYFDKNTLLHHNGAREYDPRTGRYIQTDPIGLDGGWSRYAYALGNPLSNTDPLGLWSATVGFFPGVGGQVTFGYNPNGSGFMSVQFGWGIGGGASYNPLGQAPGYCSCSGSSWTLGYGVYGQASFRAGPVSASLGANLGRNANSCGNDLYGGMTKNGSLKDVATGVSASVSGGGQLTLSGGGSAQGGCTCGG